MPEDIVVAKDDCKDALRDRLIGTKETAVAVEGRDAAHELIGMDWRVRADATVSSQEKVLTRHSQQAMRREDSPTAIEDDLPRPEAGDAATLNCRNISRPDGGQHARSIDFKAGLAGGADHL